MSNQSTVIEPKEIALESSLLNVMSIKQNYIFYNQYIDYKRLLPPTALVLKDYETYYKLYPEHTNIEWGFFYTQFSQNWHKDDLNINDIEYYRDYVFPAIVKANGSDVESCLIGLIEKQTKALLLSESGIRFDLTKLREILDGFELKHSEIIKTSDCELTRASTVNLSVLSKEEGIQWWLPSLQKALGSMVKGQLIVFSADVNTGKSAAIISQVAHNLGHLKAPILYFNSEGTDADVYGRVFSNVFRESLTGGFEEIVVRQEEVREKFISTYGDNDLYVLQIQGNVDWVHKKILKYSPALVIIDIADSLSPTGDTDSLKQLFDKLRRIAGLTCPILATTQSGDTQYKDRETGAIKTRKWLTDKDTYGSKTGKPGAADTMIMMGKDDNAPNVRYISVTKKKRGKAINLTCELIEKYSLIKEMAW